MCARADEPNQRAAHCAASSQHDAGARRGGGAAGEASAGDEGEQHRATARVRAHRGGDLSLHELEIAVLPAAEALEVRVV